MTDLGLKIDSQIKKATIYDLHIDAALSFNLGMLIWNTEMNIPITRRKMILSQIRDPVDEEAKRKAEKI